MNKIITLIAFTILFSCSIEKQPTSKLLIPKDEMSALLKHLHLHDGTMRIHNNYNRSIMVSKGQYDSIFRSFDVTEDHFQYSMIYYTEAKELPEIYEKVMDSLSTYKSIIEAEIKEENNDNSNDE